MKNLLISNVRLVKPGTGVCDGAVLVSGGCITEIDPGKKADVSRVEVVDGHGNLLTPGLIDMHTHGIGRFIYGTTPEDILHCSRLLPAYGTTCVFPTVVPGEECGQPAQLAKLEQLAGVLDSVKGVRMPGLHLEGPFLALPGAGCSTLPGDVGLLNELIDACKGRLSIMSISPEQPNMLSVIERLREVGVVPFITHTGADARETQAAIDAGARHATHFYDVFPLPPSIEPGVRPVGVLEAILADPRATADFICDGCHVDPLAIKVVLAAKGYKGVCLITDSNVGAGLPPGVYDTPLGYSVRVKPGDGARVADGYPNAGLLAGSALTMNVGVANLLKWLDLPADQVWAMGTLNPAEVVGMEKKGRIEPGADADLVLWNEQIEPIMTWVSGKCVYERGRESSSAP
ncbi:N-acetylglucosamine-6-phosphate deacetylase [Verrucomicrobiota bacterium]